MKTVVLAAALVGLALPAYATSWYVLDGSATQCKLAVTISPLVASPYVYEQGLRADGHFKKTDIYRSDRGDIIDVSVVSLDGISVLFFPTREGCMSLLESGLKRGVINNPNELK
jgi:hypothetical protein